MASSSSSEKASENEDLELESLMQSLVERWTDSVDNWRKEFLDQEEFIHVRGFFDDKFLREILLPQMERARPYLHRNYIPLHKKVNLNFEKSQTSSSLLWNSSLTYFVSIFYDNMKLMNLVH